MKTLVLSYELSWRTKDDKKFMKSAEWIKVIRPRVLKRDDYTCQYCGFRSEKRMQINHIDGNPKNNNDENLEVICGWCHMITHSGLWCAVFKSIDVYEESKYNQNEIIQITRKMRDENKSDNEIIEFLGLKKQVSWKQNLEYLAKLYGFISSRQKVSRDHEVTISEDTQRMMLKNKGKW